MTLPVDMRAKLLEATRAQPSPTRAEGARSRLWVVGTGIAVAVSLFFVFVQVRGEFQHGAGRPVWFLAATLVGWTCVAACATWVALRPGEGSLGPPWRSLVIVVLATPAALFGIMLALHVADHAYMDALPRKWGWWCLGITMATGTWPLLALALVRRASDPRHPTATGAALGVAAGAWAGVLTDVWCPLTDPAHVARGHILPIFLLAFFGAVLGRWIIGMGRRLRLDDETKAALAERDRARGLTR